MREVLLHQLQEEAERSRRAHEGVDGVGVELKDEPLHNQTDPSVDLSRSSSAVRFHMGPPQTSSDAALDGCSMRTDQGVALDLGQKRSGKRGSREMGAGKRSGAIQPSLHDQVMSARL